MDVSIVILLFFILVSSAVAIFVYNDKRRIGKNPWAWTISSFIITAVVLFFTFYAVMSYAFSSKG